MKKLKFWNIILFVALAMPLLVACGDDNEDGGGGNDSKGLKGWYATSKDLNGGATEWLDDLYDILKGTVEIFGGPMPVLTFNSQGEIIIDNDKFIDNKDHVVYCIENSNTIVKYYGHLYKYGALAASGSTFLFKFYHPQLGMLALYGTQSYHYTYWTYENKLNTTEPEIYTITANGLIPDGSSDIYVKYSRDDDHYVDYNDNNNNDNNNNNDDVDDDNNNNDDVDNDNNNNDNVDDNGDDDTFENDTIRNPITVSQIYDIVSYMPDDEVSVLPFCTKGKICSIRYPFSTDYGTAVFNISDNGWTGDKEFTVYNTYYKAHGRKWKNGDPQIAVGDVVVVYGYVVNYRGTTPEFADKQSYIVSINGR